MRTERGKYGVYRVPDKDFDLRQSYFAMILLIVEKAQELQQSAFLAFKAMDAAKEAGASYIAFENVDLHREKHLYKMRTICSNMDDLLEAMDEEIELAGRK